MSWSSKYRHVFMNLCLCCKNEEVTVSTTSEMACKQSATGSLEQWASKVLKYSTQYDSQGWPATAAIGQPKVYPRYGDIRGTWAQGSCSRDEFIELGFDTSVYVSAIHIYETLNSGGVKRVSVQSPRGSWDTVWETDKAKHITSSRIFTPEIKPPDYKTNALRLDIDCMASGSWVEIDAVQLVGRKLKFESPQPLSTLAGDFAKLVNDKGSSDVVFRAEGKLIYAHRAILSVRSQKLKDMLADARQGDVLPIEQEIGHLVFLGVLHYIYSGSIPNEWSPETLVDVWRADKKLEVPGLRAYCVTKIDDNIDSDNAVNVFANASEKCPISEDIREVCLEFLASNLATVSLTPEFKALSKNLMLEIVQLCTARMSIK